MNSFDHLRQRIATEAGLHAGMASRLRGDTLDELTADAERLAAALPAPAPPPTHDRLIERLLADNCEKHRNLIDAMHTDPDGEKPR